MMSIELKMIWRCECGSRTDVLTDGNCGCKCGDPIYMEWLRMTPETADKMDELEAELAGARAEIEQMAAKIGRLSRRISVDATDRFNEIECKDLLIGQMREALRAVENIGSEYSRMSGNLESIVLSESPELQAVFAALSAAERVTNES